jgi:alkanesulfonate monooxygenase SsuD/methylene tetrahydromethanopterin reductase-like flavin-dependent oxidoreductase (luciferase family)
MAVETRDRELDRESELAAGVEPVVQQGRWPESERPMSLGLMLPLAEQNAVANDSPVDGFWDIVAMARLAIEIGFDMLWLPDHFMLKLERHGGQARGVWECWTTTAGIAAALPGFPIGTMVACTGFHNPGSIAKMAETIDDISRGNFVLGLGCGWHADEYQMYGLPFDHRVDRFEEALRIISPLVRTGQATFEGEYYQAHEAINFPRGPRWREGGPPILFGANKPRMMRLTALYADAWNADWQDNAEIVAERMKLLDEACREVGREPSGLVRTGGSQFAMAGCQDRWYPIRGSVDEMAAAMHSFRDVGLVHYLCAPDPCTLETLQDFAKVIEAYDRG